MEKNLPISSPESPVLSSSSIPTSLPQSSLPPIPPSSNYAAYSSRASFTNFLSLSSRPPLPPQAFSSSFYSPTVNSYISFPNSSSHSFHSKNSSMTHTISSSLLNKIGNKVEHKETEGGKEEKNSAHGNYFSPFKNALSVLTENIDDEKKTERRGRKKGDKANPNRSKSACEFSVIKPGTPCTTTNSAVSCKIGKPLMQQIVDLKKEIHMLRKELTFLKSEKECITNKNEEKESEKKKEHLKSSEVENNMKGQNINRGNKAVLSEFVHVPFAFKERKAKEEVQESTNKKKVIYVQTDETAFFPSSIHPSYTPSSFLFFEEKEKSVSLRKDEKDSSVYHNEDITKILKVKNDEIDKQIENLNKKLTYLLTPCTTDDENNENLVNRLQNLNRNFENLLINIKGIDSNYSNNSIEEENVFNINDSDYPNNTARNVFIYKDIKQMIENEKLNKSKKKKEKEFREKLIHFEDKVEKFENIYKKIFEEIHCTKKSILSSKINDNSCDIGTEYEEEESEFEKVEIEENKDIKDILNICKRQEDYFNSFNENIEEILIDEPKNESEERDKIYVKKMDELQETKKANFFLISEEEKEKIQCEKIEANACFVENESNYNLKKKMFENEETNSFLNLNVCAQLETNNNSVNTTNPNNFYDIDYLTHSNNKIIDETKEIIKEKKNIACDYDCKNYTNYSNMHIFDNTKDDIHVYENYYNNSVTCIQDSQSNSMYNKDLCERHYNNTCNNNNNDTVTHNNDVVIYNNYDSVTYNNNDIVTFDNNNIVTYDNNNIVTYDNNDSVTYNNNDSVTYNNNDSVTYNNNDSVTYDNNDSVTYNNNDSVTYNNNENVTFDNNNIVTYDNNNIVTYDNNNIVTYDNNNSVTYNNNENVVYNDNDSITYNNFDSVIYNNNVAAYNTNDTVMYSSNDTVMYSSNDTVTYSNINSAIYSNSDIYNNNNGIYNNNYNTYNKSQNDEYEKRLIENINLYSKRTNFFGNDDDKGHNILSEEKNWVESVSTTGISKNTFSSLSSTVVSTPFCFPSRYSSDQ